MEIQKEKAKGLQKIAQIPKEKELSRKKDEYANALEKERVILDDFHSLIEIATNVTETTITQTPPTLVYWHDDEGEHCIATNEQILLPVGSLKISKQSIIP